MPFLMAFFSSFSVICPSPSLSILAITSSTFTTAPPPPGAEGGGGRGGRSSPPPPPPPAENGAGLPAWACSFHDAASSLASSNALSMVARSACSLETRLLSSSRSFSAFLTLFSMICNLFARFSRSPRVEPSSSFRAAFSSRSILSSRSASSPLRTRASMACSCVSRELTSFSSTWPCLVPASMALSAAPRASSNCFTRASASREKP
mmetsp:Transcript_118096/g.217348  ORF Transcript_118096/g.217348 Transcript_118096/m.217348 type:complete len:207 (-) Transcript_118096:2611-3231(-)